MLVATVGGIVQLAKARVTRRDIRQRDRRCPVGPQVARHNAEAVAGAQRRHLNLQALDARQRRRSSAQCTAKRIDMMRVSLHVDEHAGGRIPYYAAQTMPHSEPMDEGPEPHSLDDALNRNEPTFSHAW